MFRLIKVKIIFKTSTARNFPATSATLSPMDNKPPTREGLAAGVNPPTPLATTAKPSSVLLKPGSSPVTPSVAAQQPPRPDPNPPDAELFRAPSYSRWFSWTSIHECEVRLLPEFFASKSPSKTPRVYLYYRNSIIRLYLRNPTKKVTFTDARKTVVGDVGSIRRVFDFLEAWGLINYGGSGQIKALKWDDKDTGKSGGGSDGNAVAEIAGGKKDGRKRICGGCKSVCTIACFACDKYDLTLCARCYVRGNYRVGVSSTDFRRVEISEDMKADWTDKETLHLLEAIMHYGDDWRRIAHHVGGRSEKECVARFIKLPFAEEFVDFPDSEERGAESNSIKDQHDESVSPSNKKMRINPLADASNPIMAQAAFLSALAGVKVAEAAAHAAVTTLSEVEYGLAGGRARGVVASNSKDTGSIDEKSSGDGEAALNESEAALMEANSMLEKEEVDIEKAVSEIVEVQLKDIHDKISRFEELDLLMEKERQQFDEMKHMLFVDQLALLSHRKSAPKTVDSSKQNP